MKIRGWGSLLNLFLCTSTSIPHPILLSFTSLLFWNLALKLASSRLKPSVQYLKGFGGRWGFLARIYSWLWASVKKFGPYSPVLFWESPNQLFRVLPLFDPSISVVHDLRAYVCAHDHAHAYDCAIHRGCVHHLHLPSADERLRIKRIIFRFQWTHRWLKWK